MQAMDFRGLVEQIGEAQPAAGLSAKDSELGRVDLSDKTVLLEVGTELSPFSSTRCSGK